jgi:hypothetical protein
MAASTIPAAKAALLALIDARPALAAVHCGWGIPANLPAEPERIYVADAIPTERRWKALSPVAPMWEEYILQVHVETFLSGNDQQTAEMRFWELVDEVEQSVRATHATLKLNGAVKIAKPDGVTNPRTQPTDDGWAASGVVRFECQAEC